MNRDEVVHLKYTDTALPTLSTTDVLFDTTKMRYARSSSTYNGFADFLAMTGLRWFKYTIHNDQAGTVNFYFSDDGGAEWNLFKTTAVPIASSTSNTDSTLVEGYRDFKAEWVNGGTNQTTFNVNLSLASKS